MEFDTQLDSIAETQLKPRNATEHEGSHPTHGSDTGTNFTINTNKNIWYCRRHKTGGSVLELIALQEGITNCSNLSNGLSKDEYVEASKKLKELYGEDISKNYSYSKHSKKFRAIECLTRIVEIANEELMKNSLRATIRSKRNLDDEDLERFKIGYFHKNLVQAIRQKAKHNEKDTDEPFEYNNPNFDFGYEFKFNTEDLVNSGVYKKDNDSGKIYSHLKERFLIPYTKGFRTVFLIGERKPFETKTSKYRKLNTTPYNEHILFHKTKTKDTLIITEGVYDALSANKAGFSVLSPITNRFPKDKIYDMYRVAKNYDKVYLAFDNDEAGEEGNRKTADALTKQGLDIYLVDLGGGDEVKDLDDWTKENGYDLSELLESAETFKQKLAKEYNEKDDIEREKFLKEKVATLFRNRDDRYISSFCEIVKGENPDLLKKTLKGYIAGKEKENKFPAFPHHEDEIEEMNSDELAQYYKRYFVKNSIVIPVVTKGSDRKSNSEDKDGVELYAYNPETMLWDTCNNYLIKQHIQYHTPFRHNKTLYNKVIEQLKGSEAIHYDQLGTEDHEVVCGDEILNLKELDEDGYPKTRQATKHDYLIRKIETEFDKNAENKLWKKFLSESVKSEEDEKKLQEYAGTILYDKAPQKYQKALMILGDTDTGKSVFIESLSDVVGRNTSSVTLKTLAENRFSKSDLENTYLNYSGETSANALSSHEELKLVLDGSTIRAEKKNKQAYKYKPMCQHIFGCNVTPSTYNEDKAFYNRFLIVEFPNRVPSEEQDRELKEKLTTEEGKKGILKWMVEGLFRRFEQKKFTDEKNDVEIKKKWLEYGNSEQKFLNRFMETRRDVWNRLYNELGDEELVKKRMARIEERSGEHGAFVTKFNDIYNKYQKYCRLTDESIQSKKKMGSALKERLRNHSEDVTRRVGNKKKLVYVGIKFVDDVDEKINKEAGRVSKLYNTKEHEYHSRKDVEDCVKKVLDFDVLYREANLIRAIQKFTNFTKQEIHKAINTLKKRGEISEPKKGQYKSER